MTPFRQEPEALRGPIIVWVGVITLVIFTLASIWATVIWKSRSRDLEPNGPAPARELGKREIGIVDQVPFEQRSEAPALRAATLPSTLSMEYYLKEIPCSFVSLWPSFLR